MNEDIIRALEWLYVKENFENSYNEYLNDNLEERYENISKTILLLEKNKIKKLTWMKL